MGGVFKNSVIGCCLLVTYKSGPDPVLPFESLRVMTNSFRNGNKRRLTPTSSSSSTSLNLSMPTAIWSRTPFRAVRTRSDQKEEWIYGRRESLQVTEGWKIGERRSSNSLTYMSSTLQNTLPNSVSETSMYFYLNLESRCMNLGNELVRSGVKEVDTIPLSL